MDRPVTLKAAAVQVSAGLILGLSAVIYAISYAALMFSGQLAPLLPYAITVTLITAAVGGFYGLFSEEPTIVSGPDSNTSSVIAGMLLTATAAALPGPQMLEHALVLLALASFTCAVAYLAIERYRLARLVRFIPFQVMAGFLASAGWLMASGALNIVAGTPLTRAGLQALLEQPWRPELLAGLALAGVLAALNKRFKPALAVPLFIVVVSVAINLVTRVGCPHVAACAADTWFFQPFDRLPWVAPWHLQVDATLLHQLPVLLPSFIAVAFVGTLTVLLSLSSLEHTYQRDFRLEPALRVHGLMTLLASALGGYVLAVSVGRSVMLRQTGGGRLSGLVSALVCLGMLFGLAWVVAWIPKVALGALVLVLGVGMLRQWFWDLRTRLPRADWLQIGGILVCVVLFGYVVGFLVGLLAACIFFVVTYSRMPAIRLATTLATVRSSVIREVEDQQFLSSAGSTCRVGRFEGYVFFGVANSIYEWYRTGDGADFRLLVLDFSHARGMDHSAATVIARIVRAEAQRGGRVILAASSAARQVLDANLPAEAAGVLEVTDSFDTALEHAEEAVLALRPVADAGGGAAASPALRWLDAAAEREAFLAFTQNLQLRAGDQLFAETQASTEMYFIESGCLEVVKANGVQQPFRLAKVVAGSMIGEMALYSGEPRTASVRAAQESELLMLTLEAWQRMQRDRPELARALDRHVIRGLANRVSRTSAALSQQDA
ncbi:SLC26A/SulP transporter family protein [Ramlibacter sp. G-1-2-2]|uniref:SLC26A/SulP transporter family protein n=1 Tax=Ramlibacter agri TaxID=2728837 RepID=A0A848H6S3_9BURK|nr:SulP family inorganic anion transporter [Ramlibacter agri]NML45020.1 SLC26A/SulP transporter family protein [Ramlibacter agri]